MAAPNIVNVVSIIGTTTTANLTTTLSNIVVNSTNSNSVAKIGTIMLSNFSANTISSNVVLNRSTGSIRFAGNVSVPGSSILVLVGKDNGFYVQEGDTIQANVSANSTATIIVGYELIS